MQNENSISKLLRKSNDELQQFVSEGSEFFAFHFIMCAILSLA